MYSTDWLSRSRSVIPYLEAGSGENCQFSRKVEELTDAYMERMTDGSPERVTLGKLLSVTKRIDAELDDGYDTGDPVPDFQRVNGRSLGQTLVDQATTASLPEPALDMVVERDLRSIRYRNGFAEVVVEDPNSIWPCTCMDGWIRDGTSSCPIHDSPSGDTVGEAFVDGIIRTSYEDIECFWVAMDPLFPVTTDSLFMYENIRSDLGEKDPTSLIEVGCGTGFAGVGLASAQNGIEVLGISDCYTTPLAVAAFNNAVNDGASECCGYLGDGFRLADGTDLTDTAFDICICNPPYLPTVDDGSNDESMAGFTGLSLMHAVIQNGLETADTLYLHVSELAKDEAFTAIAEQGVRAETVGETRRTPFRVHPSLETDRYVSILLDRGLEHVDTGPFPYWHEVTTYRIE